MPQSLSKVVVHIVFSTKNREPMLDASVRPRLFGFLSSIARDAQCECYRVGGVADHVHLAVRLSRTITVAEIVELLKAHSSKWLKMQSADLANFSWQRGYGAFSVDPSALRVLLRYIDNQEEHHRKRTYQEEYRAFLKQYEMEYDERYMWD